MKTLERPIDSSENDSDGMKVNGGIPRLRKNAGYTPRNSRYKDKNSYSKYDTVNDSDEEHAIGDTVINACKTGQVELIEEYLKSHDINDFLYTGWTILLYAASFAQAELIEYLLTNGADPNKHRDGYTPLMALCYSTKGSVEKCMKCLGLLIAARANVDATNKRRETPLMYACQSQSPQFITELIKHVKNINACDSDKQTALFYAVSLDKIDIVKILLDNEADTTLTDNDNNTVKDIAEFKGYTQISSLLNTEEDKITTICNVPNVYEWQAMFPALSGRDATSLDFNVKIMLFGMGLDKYHDTFRGLDLKTFLQLTEDELLDLGMDISAHRVQYVKHLQKFHKNKWSVQSIGGIRKSLPYTMYDAIVTLGTVSRQVAVIGASFRYSEKSLESASNKNVLMTDEKVVKYEQELKKAQKALRAVKLELLQVHALAKKIKRENGIGMPAMYIAPKRKKTNWPIIIGFTLIIGMYLTKVAYVQRLWIS